MNYFNDLIRDIGQHNLFVLYHTCMSKYLGQMRSILTKMLLNLKRIKCYRITLK